MSKLIFTGTFQELKDNGTEIFAKHCSTFRFVISICVSIVKFLQCSQAGYITKQAQSADKCVRVEFLAYLFFQFLKF